MSIGSEKDLLALQNIGKIVGTVREAMIKAIRPGISTKELDELAGQKLADFGARSAPKYEYYFPGHTCISVNDEAAHGIPGRRKLKEGDTVNIDVSAERGGYFADTGASVVVGSAEEIKHKLCECSRNALFKAIQQAKAGAKINRIGKAIASESYNSGFKVIKNLTGHGIGRRLHEEPLNILNYFERWDNQILNAGLVLAIETFVSTGAEYVREEADGWTLKTPDKSLVAQFEHTIVVTEGEPIILTL